MHSLHLHAFERDELEFNSEHCGVDSQAEETLIVDTILDAPMDDVRLFFSWHKKASPTLFPRFLLFGSACLSS
jgi:hypothetical protein